jgi:adenosylcobinamide-GDP ribazoletransferase
VTGLLAAARYLTIVPIPGAAPGRANAFGSAAVWFPVIGVGLGAILVGVDRATALLFPSLLTALLTVTAWKLLTGGLHLDGLAERDPAHRLAIMRDSRIGAFGAMGLILVLLLEIVAVSELPPALRGRTLLVVPVIARATPPLLVRLFRPARSEGSGAAFSASVDWWAAPVALAFALAVALAALQTLGALVFALSLACAVALTWFIVSRVSGITGDVLGAAIEVAELTGLLAASAWSHLKG